MEIKIPEYSPNVRKIQTALGLTADGIFGKQTESKVIEFQLNNDLPGTGIVDDETWNKLIVKNVTVPAIPTILLITDELKNKLGELVTNQLIETLNHFPIINKSRLAHLLGQSAHESQNFTHLRENLNYSADGLMEIFSTHFHSSAFANGYAHNPEKIANYVYANQNGNGPESSGDGWKYRGGGYLGSTGKCQYQKLSTKVNDDLVANPDLIATKYPMAAAAFFFDENHLFEICDEGVNNSVVQKVTHRINPPLVGLDRRIVLTKEYYSLL